MKRRCYRTWDKDYRFYGGRGVRVCKAWLNFRTFQAWCEATFEEGKTLDRKKSTGNYCPSNCRWATAKQQSRHNKKRRA